VVEFSEDLNKRFSGVAAMERRIFYRLAPRKGEIPYFNGGLAVEEFSLGFQDLAGNIRALLSDFHTEVLVEHGRVTVGNIRVAVPGDVQ
jgi:hypothetical protein